MKKIYTFAAVAIAMFAAASCEKETPATVNPSDNGVKASFTAELPSLKTTIADDGSQTWRVGDWIMVSNGSTILGVNNQKFINRGASNAEIENDNLQAVVDDIVVAEWIKIESGMLSGDGKVLSFSTSVATPASRYYFVVLRDKTQIYSFSKTGTLNTRQLITTSNRTAQDGILVGSCSVDDTDSPIIFYNTLSYVSFNCSTTPYYAVTIMANSIDDTPQDIARSYNVTYAGVTSNPAAESSDTLTIKNAGVTAIVNSNTDTWKIPLAPGMTFSKGFSLILWPTKTGYETAAPSKGTAMTLAEIKAKTDWSEGDEPKIISTSSTFSTQAGHMIDFGDISTLVKYDSYYEFWEDGNDIVIDGVAYNKATNGSGTLLSSDASISSDNVYFVKDGVTASLSAATNNVIVIGDSIDGSRGANLSLNSNRFWATASAGQKVILKGLNVSGPGNQGLYWCTSDNEALTADFPVLVIDNCFVDNSSQSFSLFTIGGKQSTDDPNYYSIMGRIAIIDSEIKLPASNVGLFQRAYNTLRRFKSILFKNSVFFMSSEAQNEMLTGSNQAIVEEFVLQDNTFVNFANPSGYFNMMSVLELDSFTVQRNYFYASSGTGTYVNFLCKNTPATYLTENNYATGYSQSGSIRWTFNSNVWSPEGTTRSVTVENQFTALDIANRNFKLNTTAYGAQR